MAFALEFNAFRFYADDGGEANSTPLAAQDTNVTVNAAGSDVIVHLRVRFDETGGTNGDGTDDYRLRYKKNGGNVKQISTQTSNVKANDASQLTDGGDTTNRSTNGISDPGGVFLVGEQQSKGTTSKYPVGNFLHTASKFTEHVYAVELISADLSDGDTLDFEIQAILAGGTFVNNIIPRITIGSSGTTIEPSPGTIATAGQAVTVVSTTPLDPALGAIATSGLAVTVDSTTGLDPALGIIALSGLPAVITLGAVLTPATAIIGTVGQPVNVAAELIMPVGPGAIAVAGLPVDMVLETILTPALAVIGLTGLPVTLILATDFQPAPASIGLVGLPVNIVTGITTLITPGFATIATSGFGVTMVLETVMSIVTGVIATVGRAVVIDLGGVLSPAFGIIAMSGRPVSLVPEIVAGMIHSRRRIIRRRLARRGRR